MKANELRIGNYLKYNNYEKLQESLKSTIITVTADDISYMNDVDTSHFIEPIPLTKEWLLKFGFFTGTTYMSLPIDSEYNQTRIEARLENKIVVKCILHDVDDGYIGVNCNYVHQLQNLYFALTGEELCLK